MEEFNSMPKEFQELQIPGQNSPEEAGKLSLFTAKEENRKYNELLVNEFKDFKSGDKITVRIIRDNHNDQDYFYQNVFFDKVTSDDGRVVVQGEEYSFYIDKEATGSLGSVDVLPGFLTDEEFEKVLEFDSFAKEDKYLVGK